LKSATCDSTTTPSTENKNGVGAVASTATPKRKKPLRGRIAAWTRWLHTYVSMFGLVSVLFFSVTGVTLNHPDWFFEGAQSLRHEDGTLEVAWVAPGEDGDGHVARLEVVEYLRAAYGIRGAMTEFLVDEFECVVTFKGPGYSADIFVDRESGDYTLTESYAGFVAVMNDLHKGRDSGAGWSLLIDVSAIVLALASASGLLLMLFIKKRRKTGLITAGIGGVALLLIYWAFVP